MAEHQNENPNIPENLFGNVKFYISGDLDENLIDLLRSGGGERMNYFSDYVTHLICGTNAEENDISDANDLYEIPAITSKWIKQCIMLKKLVNTKPYLYNKQKLFTNLLFTISKLERNDLYKIWSMITYYGGQLQLNLNCKCNYLITYDCTSEKYCKAEQLGNEFIKIVTPDWLIESIKQQTIIQTELYHPKLIKWPKTIKYESTTSITGFEPEKLEILDQKFNININNHNNNMNINNNNNNNNNNDSVDDDKQIIDSTQALLDKLKQRMPWNQPQSTTPTTTTTDIIPPNVVAPSFLNKTLLSSPQQNVRPQFPQTPSSQSTNFQQHSNLIQNQIPRSIVHHQPQQQQQQQQQQQNQQFLPNQVHLQRLVGQQQQQQVRPNIQQLRAQLSNNPQLQQQLLQQKLLQSQQQSLRPVAVQQQYLQQQQQQQQQLGVRPLMQQNQQFSGMVQQQQQQQQQQPEQTVQKVFVSQSNLSVQQFNQQTNQQFNQQNFVQNQSDQNLGQNQQFSVFNQQHQQQQQQSQQQQQQQQQPQQNQIRPLITNQQQPQLWQQQQQQQIRQPINIVQQSPRLQWSPNQQQQQQQQPPLPPPPPQRQFIQLDAQTHNQLQKMPPEQQALFVARLKQKQLLMQKQLQQRAAGHILIRGSVPPGLTPQQQMQWLQQQAKQQGVVLPPNIQQQTLTTQSQQQQQTPGLSPIQQQQFIGTTDQIRQYRLQQLQLQREQAQKGQLIVQQQQQQQQIRPPVPSASSIVTDNSTQLPTQQQQQPPPPPLQDSNISSQQQQQHPLVVNAKTKTALANMLSIRLQSGGNNNIITNNNNNNNNNNGNTEQLQSPLPPPLAPPPPPPPPPPEPSAAGTLRLMTAQHNAALNQNNRPQDLIALQQQQQQQRRIINGPNGEIIRTVQQQQQQQQQQSSTSSNDLVGKLQQFSPRNSSSSSNSSSGSSNNNNNNNNNSSSSISNNNSNSSIIPMQHRPGPFYGHNPRLQLPPDLFLLGCIFVVVEIENYLNESIPNWQQKIEKYGGEIEKQYCNRVTHVLCETQRHGVVMQALRDCKRCITIYWLSDIMQRKQVLPPWQALHLPTIYLDTTPLTKHLISISGFYGTERIRVKHMINYIGAKFTTYFSKHNTLLITTKIDGPKYQHAKKWNIPIVNIQWLTDIMLGNFNALNQIEHLIYQQYGQQQQQSSPNFSFDPKLVPNLMHAWKMPINISQESYERVKRSASPVVMPKKLKKIKTEHSNNNNDGVDDDNNDNNGITTKSNQNYYSSSPSPPPPRILFSMTRNTENLKKIVKELNGELARNHNDATHLIMPTLARTNKLLFSIIKDIKILPEKWLLDSYQAKKFLDPINYLLLFNNIKEFNFEYKCDIEQTIKICNNNNNNNNRLKLFDGRTFWVTPSVFPNRRIVIELIQLCGGYVERIRRTAIQIEQTNLNQPYSYIIITHENDIHLVADLLKNRKDRFKIVCSAELIFSAILKQRFDVEPYTVKVL